MSVAFVIENRSGDTIRGDLHIPSAKADSSVPVMIVCHGFKGFKDWGFFPYLADRFAESGIAAIRFNFSHNGVGEDLENFTELDKFAVNTIGKEVEDLESVLESVVTGRIPGTEGLARDRIGILGHSRGAAAMLLVGSRDPRIKLLVAWAGISTVDRFEDEVKEEWRRNGKILIPNARTGQQMPMDVSVLEDLEMNREEYDLLRAVESLRVPFLVVHGDEDETVPFSEGSVLHDKTPRGLRSFHLIPGGGHTFGAVHPFAGPTDELEEAVRTTLDWVSARI